MQWRESKPLDLVDIVVRGELARTAVFEVGEFPHALEALPLRIVERPAALIHGECRMGLIVDPRLDADDVFSVGRRLPSPGELIAIFVEPPDLRHDRRCQRHDLVGTLEKVVLVGRLIDLGDKGPLAGGIGARRVEMLGSLFKGAVINVGCCVFRRIGVVPGRFTTLQQHDHKPKQQPGWSKARSVIPARRAGLISHWTGSVRRAPQQQGCIAVHK